MANMGKFSFTGMKEFQKQLDKIQKDRMEAFVAECAKELAARLLAKVIKRTPVGDYSGDAYTCAAGQAHKGHKVDGMVGGTLRRGWTSRTQEEAAGGGKGKANAREYVASLAIIHTGNTFRIEIVNPVEYASYVEYGHRTASHKGWVPGHFMLTISEQELQNAAPRLLENKIKKFLEECMK